MSQIQNKKLTFGRLETEDGAESGEAEIPVQRRLNAQSSWMTKFRIKAIEKIIVARKTLKSLSKDSKVLTRPDPRSEPLHTPKPKR